MRLFLDYFFSLEGSLNRKRYIVSYFLGFSFFALLIILLIVPIYFYVSYLEDIILFGLRLPIILYGIGSILLLPLLIMNRLSILIRRLKFLRMNKRMVLLFFILGVGLLFDYYLMLRPDHKVVNNEL